MYCSSLLKEQITLKYTSCSQVQKVEEVTDPFSQRLKNVEHPTEEISTQQVAMKTSNTGFINILGLLFRRFWDKNVIPTLLLLHIVCFVLGA
jgi:hypothetical protein